MYFCQATLASRADSIRVLKRPGIDAPAQSDPRVSKTVSEMLSTIERDGLDAVRNYARILDNWDGRDFELDAREVAASGGRLPGPLRRAIELGAERTAKFAGQQRRLLTDFETELEPGLTVGQRYVAVDRVGAYLPAGKFPLTASAFMTVNVAKVAGVRRVIGCTPPGPNGRHNAAVVYAAHVSGIDRVFVLGGVQALAAMAFGLVDDRPVNMIVGAGNAYVAEAKRQLFGAVSIDLLAGPSEVAVLADETADPVLVAADLLGQAEHGVNSPAALVTTSEQLGVAVIAEIDRQLKTLSTSDIAGPAWRDYGSVTWAADDDTAIALMDELAPEHLELQTADDNVYHQRLKNYGSIFLGAWSTVAYSDKGMAGTNHVLPTAGGAQHSSGLSVANFLKSRTYQRIDRQATPMLAPAVELIAESEGMSAHQYSATLRTQRYASG